MVERELTPNQIRNRLILAAWTIARDHAPVDGRCPVCRLNGCNAALVAVAYLKQCGEGVARGPGQPAAGRRRSTGTPRSGS